MSGRTLFRGHPIYEDGDSCRYVDTGELTHTTWRDRPCGHCAGMNTPAGHDACLGTLPGVVNACCGHGERSHAYVVLDSGERLAGADAHVYFAQSREPVHTYLYELENEKRRGIPGCAYRGSKQSADADEVTCPSCIKILAKRTRRLLGEERSHRNSGKTHLINDYTNRMQAFTLHGDFSNTGTVAVACYQPNELTQDQLGKRGFPKRVTLNTRKITCARCKTGAPHEYVFEENLPPWVVPFMVR